MVCDKPLRVDFCGGDKVSQRNTEKLTMLLSTYMCIPVFATCPCTKYRLTSVPVLS